ncbi:MAG: hypothetical protein ACOC0J_02965 [Myxococcota bacterium]
MGRYDWLYELRPVPIKEKVIEEVARHVAGDLESWPPPIEEWLSETDRERFSALYEEPSPPGRGLLRYSFAIVRLELQREFEAIDYEMRNETWREHGSTEKDRLSMLLLVRWLTDVLLAVSERSGQRLTRADLVRIVDEIERRLAPAALA